MQALQDRCRQILFVVSKLRKKETDKEYIYKWVSFTLLMVMYVSRLHNTHSFQRTLQSPKNKVQDEGETGSRLSEFLEDNRVYHRDCCKNAKKGMSVTRGERK